MDWKGVEGSGCSIILFTISELSLPREELRETTKILRQGRLSVVQKSEPGRPEKDAEVLATRLWCKEHASLISINANKVPQQMKSDSVSYGRKTDIKIPGGSSTKWKGEDEVTPQVQERGRSV
jgi:hypothetical protein